MKKQYSNKWHILIFLLPALILFCGVLIAPIGASVYYSFFDWNGLGAKTFIGLNNYKELFSSNAIGFMKALRNSLLLAALSVFLQLPLALALALMTMLLAWPACSKVPESLPSMNSNTPSFIALSVAKRWDSMAVKPTHRVASRKAWISLVISITT